MKKNLIFIFMTLLIILFTSCTKSEINKNSQPVISLLGGDVTLYLGDEYVEPGCSVEDDFDKDITCKVSGDIVDVNKAGTYKIVYSATDSNGNEAIIKERNVTVKSIQFNLDTNLKTVDIANEFIAKNSELPIYNLDESEVSYVNAETFIKFLDGIIRPLEISKVDDSFIVKYVLELDELQRAYYSSDSYTYEMEIDFKTNVIKANDIDIINGLNVETISDFSSGLRVVDYELSGEVTPIVIDLDYYNIDIVKDGSDYYMPLYLANFLFSGFYVNVYEMGENIYVTDYFSELAPLKSDFDKVSKNTLTDELKKSTESFYALVFDYFYGLKGEREVSTYKDLLANYEITNTTDYNLFYNALNDFLLDLDDLHTSEHTFGYNGYDIQLSYDQIYEPNTKYNKLYSAINKYECRTHNSEIESTKINDNTYIISIYSFTSRTGEILSGVINSLNSYENIVFDLTCNTGGMLAGVINTVKYMTNDSIPIRQYNLGTGQKTITYYKGESDLALNKNFYLMTSNVTYSAANLMTSIVKDMGLATIVGENSLGGACAISLVTSPDGTIFQMSSNNGLINKNDVLIEDGIEPDYYVDTSYGEIVNKIIELINQ